MKRGESLNLNIIEMSVLGSMFILLVLFARLLSKNHAPKWIFTVLWGICTLRLLLPFSAAKVLIGQAMSPEQNFGSYKGFVSRVNHVNLGAETSTAANSSLVSTGISVSTVLMILWVLGATLTAVWLMVTYIKCRKAFNNALPVEDNFITKWRSSHKLKRKIKIKFSDRVSAPLTYGIINPVILLPMNIELNEDEIRYILEHEYTHIKRFDAVFKLMLSVTLCIHWFNPLVWAMYVIANRDIEFACDEEVIKKLGESERSKYAMTLINMEEKRILTRTIFSGFGANSTEERVKSIMKKKNTGKRTAIISAAVIVALAVAIGALVYNNSLKVKDNENVETGEVTSIINSDIAKADSDVADVSKDSEDTKNYEAYMLSTEEVLRYLGFSMTSANSLADVERTELTSRQKEMLNNGAKRVSLRSTDAVVISGDELVELCDIPEITENYGSVYEYLSKMKINVDSSESDQYDYYVISNFEEGPQGNKYSEGTDFISIDFDSYTLDIVNTLGIQTSRDEKTGDIKISADGGKTWERIDKGTRLVKGMSNGETVYLSDDFYDLISVKVELYAVPKGELDVKNMEIEKLNRIESLENDCLKKIDKIKDLEEEIANVKNDENKQENLDRLNEKLEKEKAYLDSYKDMLMGEWEKIDTDMSELSKAILDGREIETRIAKVKDKDNEKSKDFAIERVGSVNGTNGLVTFTATYLD